MKRILLIARRETGSYFSSPIAWVLLAMFSGLCGYFFYRNVVVFSALSMQAGYGGAGGVTLNANEAVLQPLYANAVFLLLFFIPLLTMRLFAEERKSGTLELLLSLPVRPAEVVLGKHLSALAVYLLALAATLVLPIVAATSGNIEAAPVVSAYIGLVLMGIAFISVGMFFSCLTENQIVAAAGSFGLLLGLWAVGWVAPFVPGAAGAVLQQLSVHGHFVDFNRGVLNSHDSLFYLAVAVFFVYATVQLLQARIWKA